MELFGFFVAWLWLLAVCCGLAVLTKNKTAAAMLPLAVLCAALVLLCCAGCFGLLREGALVLLGAGFVGFAAAWALRGRAFWRRAGQCLASPAWLLVFGGTGALALLLALRQPLFSEWDEFSFWGAAAKVVWQNGSLYTLVSDTNLAARSYPPALPLLGYLFSCLSPRFAPWLVYAGYGVLMLAVMGAAVGLAEQNKKAAVLGGLVCLLLPFAAESWTAGQTLRAYTTAYADLMLGLLAAGCLVLWYGLRQCPPAARLAVTGIGVAALALVKDVGLPLGLVVALAAAADCLADAGPSAKTTGKRRLLTSAAVFVLLAAVAAAAYMGWAAHLSAALEMDRSQAGGSAGLSTGGMLVQGVKELLGIGRSEKFTFVFRSMVVALLTVRVSVFGSGVVIAALVWALLALAALLRRAQAGRALAFGIASTAGFAGYNFFQLLCYVYVFSDADGRGLASYPRYMSTWYLFWLLGAFALLLNAMAEEKCSTESIEPVEKYKTAKKNAVLLAVTAAVTLAVGLQVQPGRTLLGRNQAEDAYQRLIEQRAAQALQAVDDPTQEKVLLVSQWDDGGRWYRYAYALEPLALYKAQGDGTIVPPDVQPGLPAQITLWLGQENIAAFLREQGITLLLLDVDDYDFRNEFAPLFTDGMAGYDNGSCCVYRVQPTDGGAGVCFVPAVERQVAP